MKKTIKKTTIFFALFTLPMCIYAKGLTLGGTRLIYNATDKEASIPLSNAGDNTQYLIQVWVSDTNKKNETIPFIATPPLFKLGPESSDAVRVVYTSTPDLPEDRESVYLLNVRAVPAVQKTDSAKRLTVSTQNVIKLIYRPKKLSARGAIDAVDKIEVEKTNNGLIFKNSTPYTVNFGRLLINNKEVKNPGMILAFSTKNLEINPSSIREVTFRAITDFGGLTDSKKITF